MLGEGKTAEYHCGCNKGYTLKKDGISCRPLLVKPTLAPTGVPTPMLPSQAVSGLPALEGLGNLDIGNFHEFASHTDHESAAQSDSDFNPELQMDTTIGFDTLLQHYKEANDNNVHPLGMLDLTHENSFHQLGGLATPLGIDGIDHADVHANMEDLAAEDHAEVRGNMEDLPPQGAEEMSP